MVFFGSNLKEKRKMKQLYLVHKLCTITHQFQQNGYAYTSKFVFSIICSQNIKYAKIHYQIEYFF